MRTDYYRNRYQKDPDKFKAVSVKWQKEHRDEYNAYKRKYYAANRERILAYQRKRREAKKNAESISPVPEQEQAV